MNSIWDMIKEFTANKRAQIFTKEMAPWLLGGVCLVLLAVFY